MADVSNKPWGSISESDYADAGAFCDASLINLNDGPRSDWSKSKCKLPVKEPGGVLSRGGVHAAAQRLAATDAPPAAKRAAARKLVTYYGQMGEDPPDIVRRLAM
jgi:hypothetical protein